MADELRGYDAKVYINGIAFDVKEGEPTEQRSTARGDTTKGGRYQQQVVDKMVVEFSFKAIRYSTVNPHTTPYFIASSNTTKDSARVLYWPNGANVDDESKAWRMILVWESYSEQFNADQGLITLSAKGKSTGVYLRPDDADDYIGDVV